MEKNWTVKPKANDQIIERLSKELNINNILANLLAQRNILNFEDAKSFFRPNLEELHNPFLMKDMDLAVNRLEKAIKNNEKILVYGDYDVDGTTSVALIYLLLSKIHSNLDFYIPDRYEEGYGISFKGIDFAHENNFSLVIALDCGIKAMDKIAYANEKKIDFIICDHHTASSKIPEAVAVLDPKRKDCPYPFKELSGCGVGFKLMQAYSQKNNISTIELFSYLDIVAISIASDIVPINGENRILMYYGLEQLNKTERQGLKSLIKISGIENQQLFVSDCVFKIGPRINAAGRIKSGREAVKLIIEQNKEFADEFSSQINDNNITRKTLDHTITSEALEMIENDPEKHNRKSTVLYNPSWHKGVIGIVASRIIETHYKPTIILTESHGLATGSARSVDGFDLYEAIDSCSDLLVAFGGHKFAAGLTLKIEDIPTFSNKFDDFVKSKITEEQQVEKLEADAIINFSDINDKFYKIIKQFEPFGPSNMTPIFITENVRDSGNSRLVGNPPEHLKLEVVDENGVFFSGIGFSMSRFYEDISSGKPFNICYSIDENNFRGNKTLQLMIRDIKL
jgi:single-stranded-DNA-specific exonuclease